MRRLILLVLVAVVACELSESPTGPPDGSPRVSPSFSFTGGSGKILGSTNQGELVEIDFDAGTVTLIGDAGTFDGDSVGWTDIAFDDSGTLFGLSRIFFESDFRAHLYTIDPSDGAVVGEIGAMGDSSFTDFDHDGSSFYGNGSEDGPGGLGQLFSVDPTDASVTWVSSDTLGYGPNPFDTIGSSDAIAKGGFAVHPVTGDLWGIEALQSSAPVVYRIDATTGVADSVLRMGLGGTETSSEYGFDALHILDDGTFIAARGGPFSNDSVLWEISSVPDSVSGLAEIAHIPLTFDTLIVGNLNGLEAAVTQDTLAVTVSLSRDTVRPVSHRNFLAVSQVWWDTFDTSLTRTDTVRVTVSATMQPSSEPASGAELRAISRGVAGSGGHIHVMDARPPGSVFFSNEPVLDTAGVLRDTLETVIDSAGQWSGFYRSSGLGGLEEIEITVIAGADTVTLIDTITVRWPGLQPVSRSGTDYVFTDQDSTTTGQRHGNNNHYLTGGAFTALTGMFSAVRENVPSQDRYRITEASLEMGGLLGVGATPWQRPHALHRWGIHVDVGFTSFDDAIQHTAFVDECDRLEEDMVLRCRAEPLPAGSANHYHLTYLGGF